MIIYKALTFRNYLIKIKSNLSKPLILVLSYIIFAMIDSESVVTIDMAKVIKSNNFSSNNDSNQKRIWRFLNNKNLNINDVFKLIINDVVSNISNVKHNKLIVTLDHMFTKNNFVTLMFTLKIDNQGIPLWFCTEKTKSNCHHNIKKILEKKYFLRNFL